jgi:hypothetical protein
MVRFSERSISIGLCVVALSIVVPSLLLKFNQHQTKEQEWSSKQRDVVSAGSVREEAPTVSAAPASAASTDEADQPKRSSVDRGSEGSHALNVVDPRKPDAIDSSTPQRNVRQSSNVKASSSRPARSSKQANRPTHMRVLPESSTVPSTLAPAARGESHEAIVGSTLASSAADLNFLPSGNTSTAHDSTQPSPQASAIQANNENSSHASAPVVVAVQHPKTRKEVEEELRNARTNGSLPRFGNPDPYGPGGSPSASSEQAR